MFCGEWFARSGPAKWTALALMGIFSIVLVHWQATGDSARGLMRLTRSLIGHRWLVECAAFASFAVVLIVELAVFVAIRRIVY